MTAVRLTGMMERTTSALSVHVRLDNDLDVAVFVNAYPDTGSRREVLEGRAYAWLNPGGTEIGLSVLKPPADPELSRLRATIPLSRRLDPGASWETRIEVPLPVVEWNPNFVAPDRVETQHVDVTRVGFRTGWFPESGAWWVERGPEPDTFWTQGAPFHLLERGWDVTDPIPVLRRLDAFVRT